MANPNNFPFPSGQGPFVPAQNANPWSLPPLTTIMSGSQISNPGAVGPAAGGGFRQMTMTMMMLVMTMMMMMMMLMIAFMMVMVAMVVMIKLII